MFEGAKALPDLPESPFEDSLRTMLQFYNDLGVILYFPDAKPPLCELVILDVGWLINVFKSVITVADKKNRVIITVLPLLRDQNFKILTNSESDIK